MGHVVRFGTGVVRGLRARAADGRWEPKVKLSEQAAKITSPGILEVRRFRSATEFVGDAIYDLTRPLPKAVTIIDPFDLTRRKHFATDTPGEDLLMPVFRRGELVCPRPALEEIKEHAQNQLAMFHPGVKRFTNPHQVSGGVGTRFARTQNETGARSARIF